jgi:GDSL-like lipase/acylhydrolase family protein
MTVRADLEALTHPRSGLGEVATELSHRPAAIAYFGASVTVQRNGYRPRLHGALQSRFGQEHRSVNGSIGGVGPVSSIFFLDQLVLPYEPALCLVEYASGDYRSGIPIEDISGAAEEIVVRLRDRGSTPCFIHTYRAQWDRRCDEVVAAWEEIAARHGVPTIDLAWTLREAIAAGALEGGELLRDEIHTNPEGSELIASLVDRALADLFETTGDPPPERRSSRAGATDFSGARVQPARLDDTDGRGSERRFRLQLEYVEVGPAVPVHCRPMGQLIGLVVLIGPDSGEIEVSWSGGLENIVLFDEFSHYQRLSTVVLRQRIPAGADVKIELTRRPVDRTATVRPIEGSAVTEPALRLVGYMVLA